MYLYAAVRMLILLLIPWGLAATALTGRPAGAHSFHSILFFFGVVAVLFTAETVAWAVRRGRRRWSIFRLLSVLPELLLLCLATVLWWLLFPGHIALAIGIWWATGGFLILSRYVTRTWALKEAVLVTTDYRLFGRQMGRALRRARHDRASLYELPQDSAFHRKTIMTLASHEPDIYVGADAKRLLDADELRVCIAHELGHSWSGHFVGYELADYVRRLLLVPVLASATSRVLVLAGVTEHPYGVFLFLTCMVLVWQANAWMSCLLGRPRELAADRYAVEVTKTPVAFVDALVKLSHPELENVFPNVLDTLGFPSHPCLTKRIQRVKAALEGSQERGSGGTRRLSAG